MKISNKLLPRSRRFRIETFLQLKDCSFLNIKYLFLCPKNPFHASHSKKYQWSQRVLEVPRGPRGWKGSRGRRGSQWVPEVLRVQGLGPTFPLCRRYFVFVDLFFTASKESYDLLLHQKNAVRRYIFQKN